MKRLSLAGVLMLALSWQSLPLAAQSLRKIRVIVLTDIEADPDDTQSLIRWLLYCNQWKVEGLIATTSIHQQNRVAPESILRVLDAYAKVQPNLLKHEKGYPTDIELRAAGKKKGIGGVWDAGRWRGKGFGGIGLDGQGVGATR